MRITILGCGTSSGVPRIGGEWGDCDADDPRNQRTRASILVESATTTILVDTGPDMRAQLLAAEVERIDAVIWTHEHADHTHGIDDLRQVFHLRGAAVPGYGRRETLDLLRKRFAYVFAGRHGYPATVAAHDLADDVMIGDIRVRTVDQPHGAITSAGLRFDHDGVSAGYATDFHSFTPEMASLFAGLDLWIADALRRAPHPTHAHLAVTLDAIAQVRPRRTILTHMDQSMDYRALANELPDDVEPGFDGLTVTLA
ncbi:MBL fold metallo-hydrolase [Sphingomonas nostoxanthinifaciens]|uniref:MBL fold metallo-hydrolase n=1 Tax=Sphingomonas nostoxanthinifaciens TaxID=2872652 RepID=UPI001CC20C4F|nr:MBL fold metallo-hydrolase [Sphingomonas nostoxanthinifaciens]UAK22838.1 MBL fold metallo-hydrolase [Sphingomonas nostoxanthinifaciens]